VNSNNKEAKLRADVLITGATEILTCVPSRGDLAGRIIDGAIAIDGERIVAVGTSRDVARQVDASAAQVIDAAGKVIAPGFVDSHTHLVFGGSRVQEYAARLTHSIAEVQAMGIPTGIMATVEALAPRLWRS
jgi:imidazolonepropionase